MSYAQGWLNQKLNNSHVNHMELRFCEIVSSLEEPAHIIQDASIKFANRACSDLSGHSNEEILSGNAVEKFVHPDDQELILRNHNKRLQGDISPYKYEFRLLCK